MVIVVVNIGTSSVKCAVFEETTLLSAVNNPDGNVLSAITECLAKANKNSSEISAFGIRMVHGGWHFTKAARVTDEAWNKLEEIKQLAPLHNPPAMDAIQILRQEYPAIPCVAVFDTSFHQTLPDKAKYYAISSAIAEQYHIQRYGFHGLAHASMLRLYCEATKTSTDQATIITVQLGSGCSMCAIKNGKSVDTTMGFSPLEGLISRTRSGDIDPAVVSYLATGMNKTAQEITEILNHESGLKGLSGTDGDMRNVQSTGVLDLFVYRIQKYLGAYHTILNGAQAIVFGGGISEHNYALYQAIFSLSVFGVELAEQSLAAPITRITTEQSQTPVWVAQVNEELEIVQAVIDID